MALSLEDKLLGEKTHYYCSSSEDEGEDEDGDHSGDEGGASSATKQPTFIPEPELAEYKGYSTNVSTWVIVKKQYLFITLFYKYLFWLQQNISEALF